MVETKIYPDFIAVDGSEGGTGAAPLVFSNSVGVPFKEGLAFTYDALQGFDLKKHISIFAAGKDPDRLSYIQSLLLWEQMPATVHGL